MATTILINTLNEINEIKLPFKFLVKLKKKYLINKALREINRTYFNRNYFTSSHIARFCRLFHAAKLMEILKDDDLVHNDSIIVESAKIDIAYFDNFSIMKIKSNTQEMIFTAVDNIKVEHIDNRDSEHSYRLVYTFDAVTTENRDSKEWNTYKEMIRACSYESLYIAFNLIVQIVFNALYEKEN